MYISDHGIGGKWTWGYSPAGRALEWHSRGQRFDPAYLRQEGFTVCPEEDWLLPVEMEGQPLWR